MSKLVIRLATEDLERIIGKDPDFKLEVTNSIVQQFTQRHLKGLVNHEVVQQTEEALRKGISEQVAQAVGEYRYKDGKRRWLLSDELQKSIKAEVESEVKELLAAYIREAVDNRLENLEKIVAETVNTFAVPQIRKQVQDEIKARLLE